MQFEALCQVDTDEDRIEVFDQLVRAGPWKLATLDGLLARRPSPLAAALVHDRGNAISRTLSRIASEESDVVVIGYRESIAPAAVVDALHAGVVDYLGWPFDPVGLDERLQLAAVRGTRRRILRLGNGERRALAQLSSRESEVLDRLSSGASNKHIAKELGVSPRTVEVHRANILGKLGVENSIGAAVMHVRAKLLSESHD